MNAGLYEDMLDVTTLSKEKTNRLLWLGRYSERAYITLHLLRKYYATMIDEDDQAYATFCHKMGIVNQYESSADFMNRYLYDRENPDSLIAMLHYANDNAIVLREEITSETLSYIQMAICHLSGCVEKRCDILELQSITDNLLAFWGSIDERVLNASLRCVLKAGKLLESIDLHIRFGYPFERVYAIFGALDDLILKEKLIFDEVILIRLRALMNSGEYNSPEAIQLVNKLFCV
jgi:hypothetical protein